MNAPIETKVKAATGGSVLGTAIAGLLIWMLDTYAFTTAPVPDAVVVAVWAVIPALLTFLGGFLARHTVRSDPAALAGRHRAVDRADLQAQVKPPDQP